MNIKINSKTFITCIAFFIITISESRYFEIIKINSLLEYCGYAILFLGVIKHFFKNNSKKTKKKETWFFLIFMILTGIGLLYQNISVSRLFVLLFTVFGIGVVSILSVGYLYAYEEIRKVIYSIVYGLIFVFLLGIFSGTGVTEYAYDGLLGITVGLNGGMLYKNYFAADIAAVYIGLYTCRKIGEKRYKKDMVIMFLSLLLIFLTNSKGGIIILFSFILANNYKLIYKIKKEYRRAVLILVIVTLFFVFSFLYEDIILGVSTYAFRFRGWTNYIDYFKGDVFHLLLGNAESFYDQRISYVMAVRNTTGFDGSLEMAWLNILIKSGFLGIFGYCLLFIRYIFSLKTTPKKETTILLSLVITLLLSSLVESYIQSVHSLFSVVCYFIITGLKVKDDGRNNYYSKFLKIE